MEKIITVVLYVISFSIITGCFNNNRVDTRNLADEYPLLSTNMTEWFNKVSSDENLDEYYFSGARFYYEGKDIETLAEYKKLLSEKKPQLLSLVNSYSESKYAIITVSKLKTKDSMEFGNVTAFTKRDGKWLRILEILYNCYETDIDFNEFNQSIIRFIENMQRLIDNADSPKYVESVFMPNGIHFNLQTGKSVESKNNLIQDYKWIEYPNITFTLESADQFIINSNTAVSIGWYQDRKRGLYLLLLQKNANGQWRQLLDANY